MGFCYPADCFKGITRLHMQVLSDWLITYFPCFTQAGGELIIRVCLPPFAVKVDLSFFFFFCLAVRKKRRYGTV